MAAHMKKSRLLVFHMNNCETSSRQDYNQCSMASAFPIIASLSYIFVAVLLYFLNEFSRSENQYYESEYDEKFGPKELLAQIPSRQIDEMCSEVTKYCFIISERSDNKSGRVLLARGLQIRKDGPQLLLSNARILIPKSLSFPMLLDTSGWKVDKTTAFLTYARTMIAGVFFSEAVEYGSSKNHNVLIIGLGGGVINNYLSSMPKQQLNITVVDIDPVMKRIAEKWYDFKETNLHRIVVEDGIKYAREASMRGEKFDAVLLDLCTNERRPLLCPIEEFLMKEALGDLSTILADTGAVIVNIITGSEFDEGHKEAEKVQKRFEEHFAGCSMLHSGAEKMLFCFNQINANENRTEKLLKMERTIDEKLGFHLTDGGDYKGSDVE